MTDRFEYPWIHSQMHFGYRFKCGGGMRCDRSRKGRFERTANPIMADLLGPPAALAVQPSEASIMTHAARSSTDGNEALAPPPPAAVPAGLASRHPFVAEPSSETLALMTPGATSPIIPPASEAAAGDADLSGDANGDADPVPGELPVVAPTIVNLDKQTVAGASKFMYLEGLRGIAAFFVANGHFVDSTFRQTHPEVANFKPFNLLWWVSTLF